MENDLSMPRIVQKNGELPRTRVIKIHPQIKRLRFRDNKSEKKKGKKIRQTDRKSDIKKNRLITV